MDRTEDQLASAAHPSGMPGLLRRISYALLIMAATLILIRLAWSGMPAQVQTPMNIASPLCVLAAVALHLVADLRSGTRP